MPIRLATREDLPAINDIYNHYVLNSTATYQEEPSTPQEREIWFNAHGPQHPVTVWTGNTGEVIAWASLSPFKHRSAYRYTVENSIYVRHDMHRKGIGRAMLEDLLARARSLGHKQVIAVISADQTASIDLHHRLGFSQVGQLKNVGIKFNRWLDVAYMQLSL